LKGCVPLEVGSAQQRAGPSRQLSGRERFDEVVVGTEVEADDAIRLTVAPRQHDDRQMPPPVTRLDRSQALEDVEAPKSRQRQIEGHQRRRRRLDHAHGGESVVDGEHLEPVRLERPRDSSSDAVIVIDDQHLTSSLHLRQRSRC